LWTLEPETGHIWATEKGLELFGFTPNEEVSFERFLSVVHPEDQEAIRQTVTEATQSGKESSVDCRIVRPDGSVRWITSRGRLQPGRSGESERLMGVSIDITELRQLKERLQAESDLPPKGGQELRQVCGNRWAKPGAQEGFSKDGTRSSH
jgi:PAS domain S-box-containing protein